MANRMQNELANRQQQSQGDKRVRLTGLWGTKVKIGDAEVSLLGGSPSAAQATDLYPQHWVSWYEQEPQFMYWVAFQPPRFNDAGVQKPLEAKLYRHEKAVLMKEGVPVRVRDFREEALEEVGHLFQKKGVTQRGDRAGEEYDFFSGTMNLHGKRWEVTLNKVPDGLVQKETDPIWYVMVREAQGGGSIEMAKVDFTSQHLVLRAKPSTAVVVEANPLPAPAAIPVAPVPPVPEGEAKPAFTEGEGGTDFKPDVVRPHRKPRKQAPVPQPA